MDIKSSSGVCFCCKQPEEKQDNPAFECHHCNKLVHLSCVSNPPSPLAGDLFFEYTCSTCSKNQIELFVRSKMTWVCVLILTLHHLHETSQGIANQGFFHYKTHIACFIDRNWTTLFGNQFKQKKNWIGTLAGSLSLYSGVVFQSSGLIIGDQGWWRLKYKLSPSLTFQIIQEMARDKAALTKRKRLKGATEDITLRTLEDICTEMGYAHLLISLDNQQVTSTNNIEAVPKRVQAHRLTQDTIPCKKKRVDSDDSNEAMYLQSSEQTNNIDSDSSYDLSDSRMASFQSERDDETISSNYLMNTSTGFHAHQQVNYDSESRSKSPPCTEQYLSYQEEYESKPAANKVSKPEPPLVELNKTSLFSSELNSLNKLPWLKDIKPPDKTLMRLTEYEEIQLLKRIEAMVQTVDDSKEKAYLRRLRAKLSLRRLKRNKHLPLFDLDNTVRYLGGYSSEDPRISNVSKERVLDRFQSSFMSNTNTMPVTVLISTTEYTSFQSPYSGAVLKPFIRRDTETSPLWLKVMDELLVKTNKNNPNFVLPCRAPIDYSYVRPHHIAPINHLCALYFWPGVDVSESLQYPEFSCVVTYRKLVIGFAFLVPDVGRNTAYVSFVLTRPEWRRTKIATFMLYHLLQTCTGQDVTLHVSPTNPAVFLYQKFGFKVEELIQDFYEKYFEINSKVCKHALLLRLTR